MELLYLISEFILSHFSEAWLTLGGLPVFILASLSFWQKGGKDDKSTALEKRLEELTHELSHSNQKLIDAKRVADEVAKERSAFLSNMCRYMAAPVNKISGALDQAVGDPLSTISSEYVETIRMNCNTALSLLRDAMEYARIDSGELEIEYTAMPVKQLLEESVDLFTERVIERGGTLSCHVSSDLPEYVKADPIQMKQLIGNLLDNAIRRSLDGNVGLSLTLVQKEKYALVVKVEIMDTGMPIPEEALQNMFDGLNQLSLLYTNASVPLKLTICKKLSNLMGGDIGVENREGGGATFWFTARLAYVEQEELNALRGASDDIFEEKNEGAEILLVEDNPFSQKIAVRMLGELGFPVDVVSSGDACFKALSNHSYSLVMVDMDLHDMHGSELVSRLRMAAKTLNSGRSVYIVGITDQQAGSTEENVEHFLLDSCLSKPLDSYKLKEEIEKVLLVNA